MLFRTLRLGLSRGPLIFMTGRVGAQLPRSLDEGSSSVFISEFFAVTKSRGLMTKPRARADRCPVDCALSDDCVVSVRGKSLQRGPIVLSNLLVLNPQLQRGWSYTQRSLRALIGKHY